MPPFPCALALAVPFPDARLASVALAALDVDKELSPLVRRQIRLAPGGAALDVRYEAATNRMLRVAVNAFLDALNLSVEVMECLDAPVLEASIREDKALETGE